MDPSIPYSERNNDLLQEASEGDFPALSSSEHSDQPQSVIEPVGQGREMSLREVNAMRSATREIPLEILGHIFELACPQHVVQQQAYLHERSLPFVHGKPRELSRVQTGRYFALTLGTVSTRWRAAALAHIPLWISLQLLVQGENTQKPAAILQLYLDRAKKHPFSLKLDFTELDENMREYSGQWCLCSLQSLIFQEYAHKFANLHLVEAPPEWLESISESLSQLESLLLMWKEEGTPIVLPPAHSSVDFGCIPKLRQLSVTSIPRFQPVSDSVASIYLEDVRAEICMQILLQCRHLVEFVCNRPSPLPGPVRLQSRVVLGSLIHFGWTAMVMYNWEDAITRHLHMPRIKHLGWGTWIEDDQIYRLFSHVPASNLQSLTFDSFYGKQIVDIRPLLGLVPSLQYLGIHHSDIRTLQNVFTVLTPQSSECFLPRLGELRVASVHTDPGVKAPSQHVVDMLKGRWQLGTPAFILTFRECGFRFEWSHQVYDELADLVDGGFDLTIVEDSQEVEWFHRS
ncbi:hypothetical protein AN958_09702 [Leucoagaricus sp. SymC.cos]|nr:hypothetical protein AN958_09702 [Leucoagaricus sp. SymC.cos]